MRNLTFTDPRLFHRLQLGALLCLIAVPSVNVVDIARLATGPRYQVVRGVELDLWRGIAANSGAIVVACLLGTALGPLWRRRTMAGVLAALCTGPLIAAQYFAENPHGSTPYHVNWLMTLVIAAALGSLVAWDHPRLARILASARTMMRAKRIERAQRPSG